MARGASVSRFAACGAAALAVCVGLADLSIVRARPPHAAAATASQPSQFHEPPGMVMQINTGAISGLPAGFSVFSPADRPAQGEWAGNLAPVPEGTGLRVMYPATLPGGYSPVRFGAPIHSAGTGWYYQRMRVRFSANWTLSGNVALKFCEPRTQQAGSGQGEDENHVIGAHDFRARGAAAFVYVLLQGPHGHARNLFEQPEYSSRANVADRSWHLLEVLFAPESAPGAGDGAYTGWVDGNPIGHYTDVLWLAAGNKPGWPYLLFDPTYGGGSHSPGQPMYWDFDQLYVSTR